jgi:carbamoyl-phosphate synthase/aspartate carbamoyltransferase
MKYNQLRCFLKRGVEVLVCPWNYDIAAHIDEFDGLFLSNGPGDPAVLEDTIKNIASVLEKNEIPVFGICLGHQLLARAAGATTKKMKFGNRGHNIPCTSMVTGKCHITSQNHGFAVDAPTDGVTRAPEERFGRVEVSHVSLNDDVVEGLACLDIPAFSVQYHP